MSVYNFDFTQQTMPTVISGPNGTTCIDPAIFQHLVKFSDAIQLGILCFILGIVFCWLLEQAYQRWG